MDDAIAWAKRCPNPMPGPSELEIRPFYEAEDLARVMSPEQVDKEALLRGTLSQGSPEGVGP